MILEMVFRGVLLHDVAARVSIRERSRYEEPVTIPSEKEVMELLAPADRLANSKNRQTQRTWERYRPILYLAADSDHDLVFPTSTGRWQTPENWRNRGFSAACFEAGLIVKDKVKGELVEKPKYVP
jgi:hypothetical protein